MSFARNVERLLPFLESFFDVDHTTVASAAATPAPSLLHHSYHRWRRCLDVIRRVLGNDALFLALLLHAGCLWGPNYPILHQRRRELLWSAYSEEPHLHSSSPSTGKTGAPPSRPSFRRATGEGQSAVHRVHLGLNAERPASTWALHVLHFLRVEELYEAPEMSGSPADSLAVSSAASSTDGEGSDEEARERGDGEPAGERRGGRRRSTTAAVEPVGGSAHRGRDGGVLTDEADMHRRKRRRAAEEVAEDRRLHQHHHQDLTSPPLLSASLLPVWPDRTTAEVLQVRERRTWAASSGLLPTLHGQKRRAGARRKEEGGAGAGSSVDVMASYAASLGAGTALSPLQCLALAKATVTLTDEEEPLVQHIATSLVQEWFDLVQFRESPAECTGSDEGGCRHAALLHARHYLFSCAIKLIAYVDGAHSALYEENIHIAAVIARQALSPSDVAEILTKSLPSILQCFLVEEVASTSLGGRSATGTLAPPPLPLSMPPAIFLIPFHIMGQHTQLHALLPPSVSSTASPLNGRASSKNHASDRRDAFAAWTMQSSGVVGAESSKKASLPFALSIIAERRSTGPAPGRSTAMQLSLCGGCVGDDGDSDTQCFDCRYARIDTFVPRMLLMKPIPARSSREGEKDGSSGKRVSNITRWRQGRQRRRASDGADARHQHPLLYSALQRFISDGSAADDVNALVLLYGSPQGAAVVALRDLQVVVRSGGDGGADGSRSGGSGSGGGGGVHARRSFIRDALGTMLEGLFLMGRRAVAMRGLYAQPSSAGAAASKGEAPSWTTEQQLHAKDEEEIRRRAVGGAVVREDSGDVASALPTPRRGVAFRSAEEELEALAEVATTLGLQALLLCDNLDRELLEQQSTALWTTELSSFICDMALVLSRPLPRRLLAAGLSLCLLPQLPQSMLICVGFASALLARELANLTDGTTQEKGSRGAVQHYPWWSTFRALVLKDSTLPSCLYPGVWPIVEKAEATVAAATARARWGRRTTMMQSHSRESRAGDNSSDATRGTAATTGNAAGERSGGRRRRRLVLNVLTAESRGAENGANPPLHRLLILGRDAAKRVGGTPPHMTSNTASPTTGAKEDNSGVVPSCLCGAAVLYPELSSVAATRRGVAVFDDADLPLELLAYRAPLQLTFCSNSSHCSSLSGAMSTAPHLVYFRAASSLLMSLECQLMGWREDDSKRVKKSTAMEGEAGGALV